MRWLWVRMVVAMVMGGRLRGIRERVEEMIDLGLNFCVYVKNKPISKYSRALNALFNAVTNEEFKKIFSTETAKEAWTILQITYEGTKTVKDKDRGG